MQKNKIKDKLKKCLSLNYLNLNSFSILETNSGSPVFLNKSEIKYCKMMFHEQKNIMKRVGFLENVKFYSI